MCELLKIRVEDYYQDELFRFMPEELFDLLDEAYFKGKTTVEVPEYLIKKLIDSKNNE